jgi:hypothetical protein
MRSTSFLFPPIGAAQREGERSGTTQGAADRVPPRAVEIPDRDKRIRAVFGLPCHRRLPGVSRESLQQYREFLAARLTFPFSAEYCEEIDPAEIVDHVVLVLGLPELPEPLRDHWQGLIAQAEIGGRPVTVRLVDLKAEDDSVQQQLIDDYWYWFWNWQ